jgi:diguanylate cyclase (GGDEF)-like protein
LILPGKKNLEKQLTEAATHDPLTGALNRAGLEVHFERTLARVQRDGGVVSVALIDIDRFKYVNDTYGHNVGDSILVQLVHLLKSRLRKADSFARWGGEEFLVLLPDTYLEGARQIAEELRLAIEQTIFEHHEKLTISVGVVASDPEDSPKDLVRRADNHLYLAKNTGRNQVVSETLESASISPGLRD